MAFKWLSLVALTLALSPAPEVGADGHDRQFSGVWLLQFEGSTFVEGATATPTEPLPVAATDWLDYPFDQPRLDELVEEPGYDDDRGCYTIQPFLVTFIGHRIQRPFGAGHMGLWRSQVTVHRTVSFERLGPAFCYGDRP
ncbi:hypothetical protein GGQ87_000196 [Brevundimonas alba]|uniref:DUF2147 domain-containing protein n=1 Tax=Brevundimonas alba TaxID=74314 RepID=A0A7X6BLI1_9CAUL|nr:hypothetical protein [Brevundimonas alba]NJC39938.1 hypothetical protein [Brevundimonas alba]